jgi:hypothetical protein
MRDELGRGRRGMGARSVRSVRACAVLAAAVLATPPVLAEPVIAEWLDASDGSWANPTRWSTNPNYPRNDVPSGTTYHAVVRAAGSPYTITHGILSYSLDRLTLDSPDASIVYDAGVLTVADGLEVLRGRYELHGSGTLKGTSISGGGTFIINGGTLDDVTLSTSVTGSAKARNGIKLDGGRIDGAVEFIGTQTVSGNGTLAFAGVNALIHSSSGVLTIGSDVVIESGSSLGQIGGTNSGLVVNRGTVWAKDSGETVRLFNRWRNEGILKVTDGKLEIGNATTANIGTIERTGGTVSLIGTLDNGGAALALNGRTGSWQLEGDGVIRGGSVSTHDGAELLVARKGALEGVTLTSPMVFRAGLGNATLTTYGGLTLGGHRLTMLGHPNDAGFELIFSGEQTLGGAGEIVFDQPRASDSGAWNALTPTGGALTIGSGITVRTGAGDGMIGGANLVPQTINLGRIIARGVDRTLWLRSVRNQAAIEVADGGIARTWNLQNTGSVTVSQGGRLQLEGNWSNSGTISLSDSILVLGGSPSSLGDIALDHADVQVFGLQPLSRVLSLPLDSSTVAMIAGGQLDVTGATLHVSRPDLWRLAGGLIKGGTVTVAEGIELLVERGIGYNTSGPFPSGLQGVRVEAPVRVADDAHLIIQSGTVLAGGRLTLAGGGHPAVVESDTSITLGESLDVVFDGASEQNHLRSANGTLTLGPNVTVRTGARGGTVGGNSGSVVNQGLISAESPGQTIAITGTFTNQGNIRAIDGGSLSLMGSWTNNGTLTIGDGGTFNLGGTVSSVGLGNVSRSGGTVNVVGTINNSGSTLSFEQFAGRWNLGQGGKIIGGIVGASGDSGSLPVTGAATMDGVVIDVDVDVMPGATLTLAGTWANNRRISASDSTVQIGGTPSKIGLMSLTNSTLSLTGIRQPSELEGITFEASSVRLGGTLNNGENTLTLEVEGPQWTIAGGIVVGGTIQSSPGAALIATGGTLDGVRLDSDLVVTSGAVIIRNNFTLDDGRRISLGTAQTPGTLRTLGAMTLDGTGEVVFADLKRLVLGNAIVPQGGALTLGPSFTVRTGGGSGAVGAAAQVLTNEGTIRAGTVGDVLHLIGSLIVNNGVIEVASGGSLQIANNFTNSGDVEIGDGSVASIYQGLQNTGTIDVNGRLVRLANAQNSNARFLEIVEQVRSARNDPAGRWRGTGITSSAAAGDELSSLGVMINDRGDGGKAFESFGGFFVSATDVLVMRTYNGDANLDGRVNADDYFRIDSGFLAQVADPTWRDGDFNYDGRINADDYFLIDSAFLGQGPPIGVAGAASAGVAVPEPSGVSVVLLVGLLAGRRLRKS